ncbi:MAG: helix-turn-helix domain-containing protein [Egibacteraceae bacterium]
MPSEIPVNGEVLRDLRVLRLLSQEGLARAAGCTRAEISAYERGTRKPRCAQLDRIVTALERFPVKAEQWQLVQSPALDKVLAVIEVPMNRRELAKLLTAGAAAAAGGVVVGSPGRGALPPPRVLHDETIALAARYPTTSPVLLLPDARHHLNVLTDALRRPLSGERTMLLVDAAETASLVARVARLAGYHGEAGAYFGLAQKLADESGYDTLRGLTRIAAAAVHGPLVAGGDGDWVTALDMVTSAAPLVGTSGVHARWAQRDLAEQYADLGREPESMRALERFQAIGNADGGEGFFSVRSRFAEYADTTHAVVIAGRCYALLARTGDARACLPHSCAAAPRLMDSVLRLTALIHARAGEPEPMCDAAHATVDLALATPEGAGDLSVAEVRGARAKLEGCDDVECVRALDERLADL